MTSSFRFDLRSTNGRRRATVHEWTTWLRVRTDVTGFVAPAGDPDDDDYTGFVPPVFEEDGLAVMVVTRPQQDLDGEDYEEISSDEVDRVVAELEKLIGTVESVNIQSALEDAMNEIYYLVYEDEEDEAQAA